MPLCISSLIVRVTLDMAGIILTAAGLGLSRPRRAAADAGMGRDDRLGPALPPRPVVGRGHARHGDLYRQPGFNLLGDGLRDVLDPKGGKPNEAAADVEDLRVSFPTRSALVRGGARRQLHLGRERLGIVGESGSGKSRPAAPSWA
jgi:hypothetical protein